MSTITSFSMFFLSFTPLWISVLFLDIRSIYKDSPDIWTEIISIIVISVVTIFSLMALKFKFNSHDHANNNYYQVVGVKEEKTLTTEFLLSYILPLFAFNFTLWEEVVLFLIFFFVFAFLCIRHNHFSVNIALELLHYRFYSCELKNEDGITINKIVICKEILTAQKGSVILVQSLNNEYVLKIPDKTHSNF